MSDGFWSGFTSYASGALNKAKEQFKELAAEESDSQDETQYPVTQAKGKEYERMLKEKTQEVEELQDLLKSHIQEFAASKRASVAENEQLRTELDHVLNNLVTVKIAVGFSDNKELQEYAQEIHDRLKAAELKNAELAGVLLARESEGEEFRGRYEELKEELLTLKEENERVNAQHSELGAKADRAFSLNQKLTAKVTELKDKLAESDALNRELTTELKAYKGELESVTSSLKSTESQLKALESAKDELIQAKKQIAAKDLNIEQIGAKLLAYDARLKTEVQSGLQYQKRFEELEARSYSANEQTKVVLADADQLRRLNAEMQKKLDAVTADLKAHKDAAENYNGKIEAFKKQLQLAEAKLKTATEALADRESQLKHAKEAVDKAQREAFELRSQVSTLTVLKESLEQDVKVERLEAERTADRLRHAESEAEKFKVASNKLQELTEVLRRQLDSKDVLLDSLSSTIEDLEKSLKETETELAQAKASKDQLESRLKNLEYQNEMTTQIAEEKARQYNSIKSEAEALLHRIQIDVEVSENYVDRRVINTFLVKFFSPTSSSHVKLQMLETLANILDFSKEQRIEVGLIEPEGLLSDFRQFITREDCDIA